MSKICIIYRPLKHQKRLKPRVRTKLSLDAKMPETLISPLRSGINFIWQFCSFILFI